MKIRAWFSAAALLLAMAFSSQPASAGDLYPIYLGDYFYYSGDYPPAPLIVPFGYLRCGGGCCRRPVWNGRHWHAAISCSPALAHAAR